MPQCVTHLRGDRFWMGDTLNQKMIYLRVSTKRGGRSASRDHPVPTRKKTSGRGLKEARVVRGCWRGGHRLCGASTEEGDRAEGHRVIRRPASGVAQVDRETDWSYRRFRPGFSTDRGGGGGGVL